MPVFALSLSSGPFVSPGVLPCLHSGVVSPDRRVQDARRDHRHGERCRIAGPVMQCGFSLVEVAIVTAIVLLIAIAGIPAIGSYVIENKVPKVGEALQRFAIRTKVNAQGGGATPYAGITTAALAHALRDNSVFDVSGRGRSVEIAHGLGGRGRGGNGVVTAKPAALGTGGAGAAFSLTLDHVSHAACPGIASVMQSVSTIMTLGGESGTQVLKNIDAASPQAYNAAAAAGACGQGDVNTFVFTIR